MRSTTLKTLQSKQYTAKCIEELMNIIIRDKRNQPDFYFTCKRKNEIKQCGGLRQDKEDYFSSAFGLSQGLAPSEK